MRIGQRAREDCRAADAERIGTAAEIRRAGELRGADQRHAVVPGAEARVARVSRVTGQREAVVAATEEAIPLHRPVGDIEHVIAAAKAHVADDGRGSDPRCNRSLLDGRASGIGRQVDRHVAIGCCKRAGGADRAAIFHRGDGSRQIDDRPRGPIVAAGLGRD